MKLLLACLAFAGLSAQSNAATLWQNVTTGMSPAQVRAAQPDAQIPAKIETLHGGAKCSLKIAKFELTTADFNVCFYFKDEKLVQVTLQQNGTPGISDYRTIVTALTARYGKPLHDRSNALGWEAEWLTEERVNVGVLFIEKYLPLINIYYQTRVAQDSSKL